MFQRFTASAREAVVLAQQEARRLRHPAIGAEHLLLGIASQQHGRGAVLLDELGLRLDDLRLEVARRSRHGPDAGALEIIGIDLEAVRGKVEQAFGPGALGRGPRRRGGHLPFTREAKRTLELALREALRLKNREIGTEHVLLGLLRLDRTLAVDLLHQAGIDHTTVQARLCETPAQ